MKQKLVAYVAAVCFGLFAVSSTASAFEDVGSTASIGVNAKGAAVVVDDSDDDESFFSGGSNPAVRSAPSVPSFKSAPAAFAAVDVVATCRAVLAEASSNYNANFYEGCRKTIAQRPIRRAAR